MLSEKAREVVEYAAKELIEEEGGLEACIARNTPTSFVDDGIRSAEITGRLAFADEVRQNRAEAERIIAGVWGLM